jgi:pyruvate/2-oxoacid:ferredoxin oxidoreductase beta subunit
MGKIILLVLIAFAGYWALKYYDGAQKQEDDSKKRKWPDDFDNPDGDPDALRAYYENKIAEIENKSVEEIEKAQDKLEHYKDKLNKLKNLKNK